MSAKTPLSKLGKYLFVATTDFSCRLLYTAGIGLTGISWLCLSELVAAIPPQQITQTPIKSDRVSQKMLFVNPGVASNGDGSETTPFKTITQALQVAEPNSAIVLAAGKYSVESGETFPLQLKAGVSIQGDPKTKGSNIAIAGGGIFISPTFARQDVTILGANSSTLSGVTVSNPNPRGYGLWIESSSPTVSDNTFTGSDHDGISVTGNSSPTIRNNHFHHNGANGITIYGTSKPEVRENVFEQTGFGINIAQKAAPLVIGNQIIKNRSGVVAQANSQPVLRNNVIEGNSEDGVVAIALSQPDLGTIAEPGGNIFRHNARYDINGSAAKLLLSAVGNQLAQDHFIGNIDLAGSGSPTITASARSAQPASPQAIDSDRLALNPATPEKKEQQTSTSVSPAETNKLGVRSAELGARVDNIAAEEKLAAPQQQTNASVPAIAPDIEIPVPLPEPTAQAKPKPSTAQKVNSVNKNNGVNQNQPQATIPPSPHPPISPSPQIDGANQNQPQAADSNPEVKIPVPAPAPKPVAPPPPPKTGSLSQGLPTLAPAPINASVLAVSSADIPNPPPPQETATSLRYRVVVEVETETQQEKVRSLVPGAFRTISKGKAILQAGIFSDRAKATEVLQLLNNNGLKAAIEQLN